MKGDLSAAQQALSALWPLLNIVKAALRETPEQPREAIANAIEEAMRDVTPLYLRAMGDDVPEAKLG